jgi:glycogen operon protein
MVSYNEKHNEANKEGNRDGTDDNRSWNCGVEGETDDPEILVLRERQQRNFLVTLFLSQGVPMILGGDEFGRTQEGNNNTWCQDNRLSWLGWKHEPWQTELHLFTRRLIALRRAHPVFRRVRFLQGATDDPGLPDAWWFRPDGRKMTQRDWKREDSHVLGVFLNGEELQEATVEGDEVVDESFLLLFNAHHEDVEFTLPVASFGARWYCELSTAEPMLESGARDYGAREKLEVRSRSVYVLRRPPLGR